MQYLFHQWLKAEYSLLFQFTEHRTDMDIGHTHPYTHSIHTARSTVILILCNNSQQMMICTRPLCTLIHVYSVRYYNLVHNCGCGFIPTVIDYESCCYDMAGYRRENIPPRNPPIGLVIIINQHSPELPPYGLPLSYWDSEPFFLPASTRPWRCPVIIDRVVLLCSSERPARQPLPPPPSPPPSPPYNHPEISDNGDWPTRRNDDTVTG